MTKTGDFDSHFDYLGERISRRLASRLTRRSLLGTVGGGGVAMALASGGSLAVRPGSAEAHTSNPCQHTSSVSCEMLYGWNNCPGWTCGCGHWTTCGSSQCTYKVWQDCCDAQCEDRECVNGWPKCILHKPYTQGCGTQGSTHVRCRRWYCGGGPCTC
jgi:hypothetical protein